MPIRNKFLVLLKQKEASEERRITYADIHRETGISPAALSAWARNEIVRFDAPTLEALCLYFDCEVGDLLVLVKGDNGPNSQRKRS